MIGDKQQWFSGIGLLDVFKSENIHQIVSRNFNPERADMPLAKRPKQFPCASIHSVGKPEANFFDG
jgi:hypothetical protein